MNELNAFSNFLALERNKVKYEIAPIGVLNGFKRHCGMKCVNLENAWYSFFG